MTATATPKKAAPRKRAAAKPASKPGPRADEGAVNPEAEAPAVDPSTVDRDTPPPPEPPEPTPPPVSTELAPMSRGALVGASLNARIRYARELAESGLLPVQYRNKPANVLYAVEYGNMLGIHPMAAITGIHIIEGKPSASAALMSALVREAGHRLRVKTSGTISGGDFRATAYLTRKDDPDFTFEATWDPDRALRAGLLDGISIDATSGKTILRSRSGQGKPQSWEKFPEAMCKARATSEVIREAAEEVLCGAHYTPEELGANVDIDGNVVEGEVVESLSNRGPEPLSPADVALCRADIYAAFESGNPSEALREVWRKAGAARDVTMIADENGVEIVLAEWFKRLVALIKAGGTILPTEPDQPAADQPAADVPADGPVDVEIVGETTPEQEAADAAEQEALAALSDITAAEPLVQPSGVQGVPQNAEQAREFLLDEVDVLAQILNTRKGTLVTRQVSAYRRNLDQWTGEELLQFVQQYREAAAVILTNQGHDAAAATYRMLKPESIVNVRAMLGDALS